MSTQAISGTQSSMQPFQMPSPAQMFDNLAQQVGATSGTGSTTGISEDQLNNYLQQLQNSSGTGDSRQAGFIQNLISNFSTFSGGTNQITAQSMQQAFQSGAVGGHHHHRPSATQMFNNLAEDVGATSGSGSSSATGITEDQLKNYLQQLESSSTGDSRKSGFVQNLINNFDEISSDGGNTITATDLQNALQNGILAPSGTAGTGTTGSWNVQDPSTVSKDQLTPPIDISV